MNRDKYIITIDAKEQIEKYCLNEWELLESQLKKIEEDNIKDGFFITKKEDGKEAVLCIGTAIVQGEIIMTVACLPGEIMQMRDIMQQSIFGS